MTVTLPTLRKCCLLLHWQASQSLLYTFQFWDTVYNIDSLYSCGWLYVETRGPATAEEPRDALRQLT